MVSCQKGPTRHAYAWQIGPFSQDTLEFCLDKNSSQIPSLCPLVVTCVRVQLHFLLQTFNCWPQAGSLQKSLAFDVDLAN